MKTEKRKDGFLALSRQASAIFACGTMVWCLLIEVSLFEAVFRAATVYLSITILSYIVSNLVARSIAGDENLEIVNPSDGAKNESHR